jgi:hypothetical protein
MEPFQPPRLPPKPPHAVSALHHLNEGAINLTPGRLQRHRVVWIREMPEADIKQVGDTGPTIDRIQVEEFESQAALKEWLSKNAPAFVR